MDPRDKLYVVVRADLAPGLQLAQALHAQRAFAEHHGALDRAWYRASNTVAVLAVPHERALLALVDRAAAAGVDYALFREPDLDDAATAACVAPGAAGRRLCRRLPLALAGLPGGPLANL